MREDQTKNIRKHEDKKNENWYALTDLLRAIGGDTRQSSKFVKRVPDPYKVKAETLEEGTGAKVEIWWLHQVGAVILLGTLLPKNEKAAEVARKLVRIPERDWIEDLCKFREVDKIVEKYQEPSGRTIVAHKPGVVIEPLYTEAELRERKQAELRRRELELKAEQAETLEDKVKKIRPCCSQYHHTYKNEHGQVVLSGTHEVLHSARLWALGLDEDGKPYRHTEEEKAILKEYAEMKAREKAKAEREAAKQRKQEGSYSRAARHEELPDDFEVGVSRTTKVIGNTDGLQDVVKINFGNPD